MIVVADTSPITALLHLNQLRLLNVLYGQVFIPSTVAAELNTLISFGYDVSFLEQQNIYIICKATDIKFTEDLSEHLDAGEAEAIALAKELKAELLLIDEKIGTQYAIAEGISCKGVAGILIEGKNKGLIPALKPLLDDLVINLKFRLSDKIYKLALEKANEHPEHKA